MTSITGSGKEAMYTARLLQWTCEHFCAIEGDVTDVQQNTEGDDKSIAILTEDGQYRLVYTSEDNEVLVQVSSRKFAYTSDTAISLSC